MQPARVNESQVEHFRRPALGVRGPINGAAFPEMFHWKQSSLKRISRVPDRSRASNGFGYDSTDVHQFTVPRTGEGCSRLRCN